MRTPNTQHEPRTAAGESALQREHDSEPAMIGMGYFPDEVGLPADWTYPGGPLTS
jgi:hypothetical protein